MPTNNDSANNSDKTGLFELPEELVLETARPDGKVPSGKKSLKDRSYFITFKELENEPTYEVIKKLSIGREQGDIVIKNSSISNEHCTLESNEGLLTITDHGSTNGTFVDGKKIKPGKPAIIDEGDKVFVGALAIEIKLENPQSFAKKNPNVILAEKPQEMNQTPKESFFSKLKAKFKFKKKPTAEKSKITYDVVGGASRIWAIVGDLALTHVLLTFIGEEEIFLEASNQIWNLLFGFIQTQPIPENIIKLIQDYAVSIFPYYFVFYFMRLLSVLVIGVTPTQFLMAIKSPGNVLWVRIGGIIRTVLEMILGPVLITDFTVLLGKRSLKEILTFTVLSPGNKLGRFFGSFILVPLILLLAFISPMLKEFDYLQTGVQVEEQLAKTPKSRKKDKDKEGESQKEKLVEMTSKTLLLSNKLNLAGDLVFIPEFVVETEGNTKVLRPKMVLINTKKPQVLEFRVAKKFDLSNLIFIFESGNPLGGFKYSEISKWAHNQRHKNAKIKTVVKHFSLNQVSEMEAIILKSLNLKLEILQDTILEDGPFIKGFVDVRDELAKLTGNEKLESITLFKTGKSSFLQITDPGNEASSYIIPLSFPYGVLYHVTYKTSKRTPEMLKEFLAQMTSTDISSEATLKKDDGEMIEPSPLNVLDFAFSNKLSNDEKSWMLQYLYNMYYDAGSKILSSKDKDLVTALLQGMKNFESNLKYNLVFSLEQKEKLIKDFETIGNALKNEDKAFFGIKEDAEQVPQVEEKPATEVEKSE